MFGHKVLLAIQSKEVVASVSNSMHISDAYLSQEHILSALSAAGVEGQDGFLLLPTFRSIMSQLARVRFQLGVSVACFSATLGLVCSLSLHVHSGKTTLCSSSRGSP